MRPMKYIECFVTVRGKVFLPIYFWVTANGKSDPMLSFTISTLRRAAEPYTNKIFFETTGSKQ